MTSTPRSTPAVLVAAGLLALSFGSGAYAAGTITGADIANGTVTTKDIKNKTIRTKDLAPGAAAALQGATGSPGSDGVSGYEMVSVSTNPIAGSGLGSVTGTCPAGKKVVGAAAYWQSNTMAVQIYPQVGSPTTAWTAVGVNPGVANDTIQLRVVCVTAS